MASKPALNAKLYETLAGWKDFEDVGSLNVHPMVPGYRLLRINDRVKSPQLPTFEVVMLCDTTKEVVYYNRVLISAISDLNIKPATQNLVWRSSDYMHSTVLQGIATNVFTNYILNNYNAIISDNNQTS